MKIAILGGSSPFTAALFDALTAHAAFGPDSPAGEIMLHGRNRRTLHAIAAYGARRLRQGRFRVHGTTDLAAALDGAGVVVNQIRFGGLEARAQDERLAEELGCPADETLGPCGLMSALRQARPVCELAQALRAGCPTALVLNLSNPLSLTTGILADRGIATVGVCELPIATLHGFLARMRLQQAGIAWRYGGFNHRGFLFGIMLDGVDLLDAFASSADGNDAIKRDVIELGALPLKYFSLLRLRGSVGVGRARELMRLRRHLVEELIRDGATTPPSLGRRNTDWYSEAVAPILAALLTGDTFETTLNVSDGDLVRELRARLRGGKVIALFRDQGAGRFNVWLSRFENHERLSKAALADPHRDTIEAALRADMMTPPEGIRLAATRLLDIVRAHGSGLGGSATHAPTRSAPLMRVG